MRVRPWLPLSSDFQMGGVGVIPRKGGMIRVRPWLPLSSDFHMGGVGVIPRKGGHQYYAALLCSSIGGPPKLHLMQDSCGFLLNSTTPPLYKTLCKMNEQIFIAKTIMHSEYMA